MNASVLGSSGLVVPRAPDIFKQNSATSGTVAVWTPATGKRFRLLRYQLEVVGDSVISGGAAEMNMTLQDAAASLNIVHTAYVPASGSASGVLYNTGWVDLGPIGCLSSAANNALNIVLSVALTGGKVRVNVAGTEE